MQPPDATEQPPGRRRQTGAGRIRLVGIFVPWQAVALTLAVLVGVTAVATRRGSDPDTVRVEQASSDHPTDVVPSQTTEPPTTTTTSAPATTTSQPPTTTTSPTATSAPTTTTKPAVVTTTTTAPARTVEVVLGDVANDASGTRVPVTVTVTHGTANVIVCLTSTIVENGSPFGGGLAFWDVSGSQTLEWSYQYAGQHITDVQIVKHLVDSRYGCR